MGELVIVNGQSVFTTSWIISQNLNIQHESVVRLIKEYSSIDELSRLQIGELPTKGRPVKIFLFEEVQALILVSLMKNSPEVIKFKINLVKAFIKYRRIAQHTIIQKQNTEWIEKRQDTKAMRRECTDVIQEFIAYAKAQGSKSAEKYYMNFSRMELTGLFLIEQKFPNARDVMNIRQLHLIEMADEAVAISLKDSMSKNIPYKECYQIAKDRICLLAKIFPPSPLPLLLEKNHE